MEELRKNGIIIECNGKKYIKLKDCKVRIFKDEMVFLLRKNKEENGFTVIFIIKNIEYFRNALNKVYGNNVGCLNCIDCTDCTGCAKCHSCHSCKKCATCNSCHSCTGCADCNSCHSCTDCVDCNSCNSCIDCINCNSSTSCNSLHRR